MKNTILFYTGLILLSGIIYAQEINPNDYNDDKTNLENQKTQLQLEKVNLEKEISQMRKEIEELDATYKVAFPKYLIKKYGKKDGQNLALGRIWKGMKREMLLDIWGQPDKQNTDKFSYGIFTQYYYGKITYFFRDGILIDWEEVE